VDARTTLSGTPREAEELLAEVVVRTSRSNREATVQALLERLDPAPDAEVLALGLTNGRVLAGVAARLSRGRVTGIAMDERVLGHGQMRCARYIAEGRVRLVLMRSPNRRALRHERFDRVYGVHVAYFWTDPARAVWGIRRVLRPGGRLVLGYWPRDGAARARAAKAERASASTARLERLLAASGFETIRTDRVRDMGRTVAWTVAERAAD
jgi:SAM-dependent methyltransferase